MFGSHSADWAGEARVMDEAPTPAPVPVASTGADVAPGGAGLAYPGASHEPSDLLRAVGESLRG